MPEVVDLAVCAIPTKGCQDFRLGECNLPARPFRVKISRTVLADIFRAVHYLPTGFFALTEI
jgi:hypothetical protein